MIQARRYERGNILLIVLIAIVLLAGLSFAVTKSGRGGKTLNREQAEIAINEMMEYGLGIQNAIARMKLASGCSDFTISYRSDKYVGWGDEYLLNASPTDGSCDVFNSRGGQIMFMNPPPLAQPVSGANYHFTGRMAIPGIGTAAGDAVMVAEVTEDVCRAVNKRVGIAGDPPLGSMDPNWRFTTPHDGWKVISQWRLDNGIPFYEDVFDPMPSLNGHPIGCFMIDTAYTYYHVLIKR